MVEDGRGDGTLAEALLDTKGPAIYVYLYDLERQLPSPFIEALANPGSKSRFLMPCDHGRAVEILRVISAG